MDLTQPLSLMDGGGRRGSGLGLAEEEPELVLNILMYRDTSRNTSQGAGTLGPECRGNV